MSRRRNNGGERSPTSFAQSEELAKAADEKAAVEAKEQSKSDEKDFVSFAAKCVSGVNVPKDIAEVLVTSDGQVFFPLNQGLAYKHAAKKKLKIIIHKI